MEFYITGQTSGKYVIDTSPSVGAFFLRPSQKWYKKYVDEEITYEEFLKQYLFRMRQTYETNRDMWDWLIKTQKTVIFGCDYRRARTKESHLPELARILVRLGCENKGYIGGRSMQAKGWITNEQII